MLVLRKNERLEDGGGGGGERTPTFERTEYPTLLGWALNRIDETRDFREERVVLWERHPGLGVLARLADVQHGGDVGVDQPRAESYEPRATWW